MRKQPADNAIQHPAETRAPRTAKLNEAQRAWVESTLKLAPPLTTDQRDRLAELLAPVRQRGVAKR